MPPRNTDERLARALILELFLTMAEQQAASEQLARRTAKKARATAAEDREGELPEQDDPPFAE